MTLARLIQVSVSFMILVMVYWVYSLVAVPWIEPQAIRRAQASDRASDGGSMGTGQLVDAPYLKQLFGPDAWELRDPKVIESDSITFLFQDYGSVDGDQMELKPCTIIFHAGDRHNAQSPGKSRPIVLRAPDGARLQFDSPMDLRRARFGRVQGGHLPGPITIVQSASGPGAGDGLHVSTRNIQLSRNRIWTPHQVDFQFGASWGRGRDLVIRMHPREASTANSHSNNLQGLRSLELVHIDRFHLEPSTANHSDDSTTSPDMAGNDPLEITCHGPFRYDFVNHVASFEDQVDVMRLQSHGVSDQLNCQLLQVQFMASESSNQPDREPEQAGEAPTKAGLRPQRMVALGHPVIVRAQSNNIHARGERIEYDLGSGRVLLEGQQRVTLQHGPNTIEAVRLEYEYGESGQLGRLWAAGPGTLSGSVRGSRAQTFTASWNDQLRMRPQGSEHVVSLSDGAQLGSTGAGTIAAQEIHLWLRETLGTADDRDAAMPSVQIHRMLALGDVHLDSAQLEGRTPHLEMYFHHAATAHPAASSGLSPEDPGVPTQPDPPSATGPSASGPPDNPLTADPIRPLPTGDPSVVVPDVQPPDAAGAQYAVSGNMIRIQLRQRGDIAELQGVTVDGEVLFSEVRTASPDDAPIVIRGDVLQLDQAGRSRVMVNVVGNPASVQARGLVIKGGSIRMNQASNLLWIDGPGWMTAPLERGLTGGPAVSGRTIAVDWKGGMRFDGTIIHYEQSVSVRTAGQTVQSDWLDVTLARRVNLSDPRSTNQIEATHLYFGGNLVAQNQTVEQGRQMSLDRMYIRNLAVDLRSGKVLGQGPGWIRSVRRTETDVAGRSVDRDGGRDAPTGEKDLTFVHVTFQKRVIGNVHRRQLEFSDQVETTYGPVAQWGDVLDANQAGGIGEDGILITCDRLGVMEIQPVRQAHNMPDMNGRRIIEVDANGNTIVEGSTFTARGHRITYTTAKDLLILRGNGRRDAELWHQQRAGGTRSRAAARKILYWRKSGRVEVVDAGFLDLSQFGAR